SCLKKSSIRGKRGCVMCSLHGEGCTKYTPAVHPSKPRDHAAKRGVSQACTKYTPTHVHRYRSEHKPMTNHETLRRDLDALTVSIDARFAELLTMIRDLR